MNVELYSKNIAFQIPFILSSIFELILDGLNRSTINVTVCDFDSYGNCEKCQDVMTSNVKRGQWIYVRCDKEGKTVEVEIHGEELVSGTETQSGLDIALCEIDLFGVHRETINHFFS